MMSSKRFDPAWYDEPARRMAEGLVDAERRLLAERRKLEDCDCKEGMFPDPGRRALLRSAAALAGAAPVAFLARGVGAEAPPGAVEYAVPDDPTKVQGRLTGDDGGYGTRSQFETEVRWRYPTATRESSWTMTPLERGHGIITPSGLHFERHHGGIPTIDPARHTLIVHGMIERPMKYAMADLKRFPSVSRIMFIECSGNGLTEWREPTLKTVQGTHGLISTSEWTGVPLSTILREVGVEDGAAWILAEGADAAVMTRSVPIDKARSDALLAYAQNGEAIRPEQGYPLRLILPGWEGNTHIKWLRRLEISDRPFMTREETFCHRALCAKRLLNTGEVLASVRDPQHLCPATFT
jgi:sulfane dehydrogenase subunit SoxC